MRGYLCKGWGKPLPQAPLLQNNLRTPEMASGEISEICGDVEQVLVRERAGEVHRRMQIIYVLLKTPMRAVLTNGGREEFKLAKRVGMFIRLQIRTLRKRGESRTS